MGQIHVLGCFKRVEDLLCQSRDRLQQGILHHQSMVDRVHARLPEVRKSRALRVGNQWLNVRRIHAYVPNRGLNRARQQQIVYRLSSMRIVDIGRRLVLRHMFIVGRSPRDFTQIHAIFRMKNPPGPQAGGHGVSAIHADGPAFQIFGGFYF